MKIALRATISKDWPVRTAQEQQAMSMTIRADDVYLQYEKDQDPKKLFYKAVNWLSAIQEKNLDSDQTELVVKETHDSMIRAIFGSNMIERAGLGWNITVHLCNKIFAGEDVEVIPETTTEYQSQLLDFYSKQSDLKDMPAQYIFRGRKKIIQHARAFQYICTFVAKQQDLTEEVIKETHRILTLGVPIVEEGFEDVAPEIYGGIYRDVPVGAGSTMFTVPQHIHAKMKQLCDNLKTELEEADTRQSIDPFSVASKYSMEFVQIHPFRDGNGRTCRMILNAILCRYAGIIVPIGEQVEERSEYINIKKRVSENMKGHGEYATFVLQRSVTRLRELEKKLTGKRKGS